MSLTIAQILDLLMALVLVMFVPIGLWRGALREWIALGGILLGAALAAEWARPWGGDLAAQAGLDPKVANFAIAALFFLLVTLLVGYGVGVALPFRPDLSWPNRLLGAFIGFGNGLLILSNALRIMQRYLFDDIADSPLRQSGLALFLIDYVGWAQLGLLVVLLLGVLVALVWRWTGREALFEEYAPVLYNGAATPGWDEAAEYGGYEDEYADGIPAGGREAWRHEGARAAQAVAEQDTKVLHSVTPVVVREIVETPAPPPDRSPAAADTPRPATVVQIIRPAAPPLVEVVESPSGDTATNGSAPATSDEGDARQALAAVVPTSDAPESATTETTEDATGAIAATDDDDTGAVCTICGTTVGARARFCPTCGHIIGDAERRAVARLGG